MRADTVVVVIAGLDPGSVALLYYIACGLSGLAVGRMVAGAFK